MFAGRDDCIYAAGLFDGEGCVSIVVNNKKQGAKRRRCHRLQVRVSSTDPEICQWLLVRFGGAVHFHSRAHRNPKWTDAFSWTLVSREAELFLRQVRPWLKIKSRQADLAFDLRATTGLGRPKDESGGDRLFNQREDLRQQLMAINHRNEFTRDTAPQLSTRPLQFEEMH